MAYCYTFQIGQIYGLKRDAHEYAGARRTRAATRTAARSARTTSLRHRRDDARLAQRRELQPLVAAADPATTRSSSTPTRRPCGSRAATTTTSSSSAPSRWPRRPAPATRLSVTDPTCQIVWRDQAASRDAAADERLLDGGRDGHPHGRRPEPVQYNINAPVSIDGGNGIDKVVVLGTEFADHFVVTVAAIYGAGLGSPTRTSRSSRSTASRATTRSTSSRRRRVSRRASSAGSAATRSTSRATSRATWSHATSRARAARSTTTSARATRSTTASLRTASTSASRAAPGPGHHRGDRRLHRPPRGRRMSSSVYHAPARGRL